MQSPDGNLLWCPSESLWSLITDHVTKSELQKIKTALGYNLVHMYTRLHSEVRLLWWLQIFSSLLSEYCCILGLLVSLQIQLIELVSHLMFYSLKEFRCWVRFWWDPTRIPSHHLQEFPFQLGFRVKQKFAQLSTPAQTIYDLWC